MAALFGGVCSSGSLSAIQPAAFCSRIRTIPIPAVMGEVARPASRVREARPTLRSSLTGSTMAGLRATDRGRSAEDGVFIIFCVHFWGGQMEAGRRIVQYLASGSLG